MFPNSLDDVPKWWISEGFCVWNPVTFQLQKIQPLKSSSNPSRTTHRKIQNQKTDTATPKYVFRIGLHLLGELIAYNSIDT